MSSKRDRADERARRAEAARAAAEAERRAQHRRDLVRGGLVALVLALVLGAGFYYSRQHQGGVDAALVPAAGESRYGLVIGAASAPHQVVVYEDFLCPYCAKLEAATHEQLAAAARAGDVTLDYRPFDLLGGGDAGSYSVRAAAAFAVVSQTSGPQVAQAFHDLLFAQQPAESGPFPSDADLVAQAVAAGADESDVAAAIRSGDGESWVTAATEEASTAGVSSTPTVLLDGQVASNQDLAAHLLDALR